MDTNDFVGFYLYCTGVIATTTGMRMPPYEYQWRNIGSACAYNHTLHVCCNVEEVLMNVQNITWGKTAGIDCIVKEMIKAAKYIVTPMMVKMFCCFFSS